MANSSFQVGLPLPALPQQGIYTAPTAPGYPTQPGVSIGYPTDTYAGVSGTTMAGAVGVGGVAGYKAPRGLESVRAKLKITKYGQRSAVGRSSARSSSYRGGNSYGNYRDNGYRNGYRSYETRGSSRGRVGYRGQGDPFGMVAAIKSSVIIGGVISVATNAWELYNKRETGAQAGANVAGDLVSAAVGGAGGAVVSTVGCGMLAAMGMSGGLLSIAGIGLGIGGYFLADTFLRNTSLFKGFQSGVYKLFGGK